MSTTRPRTWRKLLELFPGSSADMVSALRSNRDTVWTLRTGRHAKVPHDLLADLAEAFRLNGTADGSETPTREELTAAYLKAFRR